MRIVAERLRRLFDGTAAAAGASPREAILRMNLRRIQLFGIVGLMICVLEFFLAGYRTGVGPRIRIHAVLAFLGVAGFMALAGAALRGRLSRRVARALPVAFIVLMLAFSVTGVYWVSLTNRVAVGHLITALIVAAVFSIPPRPFAVLMGATALGHTALLLAGPLSSFDRLNSWFNTVITLAAAIAIRAVLHRIRQRERQQAAIIARQKHALQRRQEEIEASNRALNEVMALAAHDLRSPLLAFRSLLDHVAQREGVPPALYRDVMREGSASLSPMLEIVGRLLEAHESERELAFHPEAMDLREVVRAAAEGHALAARQAGIALRLAVPDTPVPALVERENLARILANLLSNAFRFSSPGSEVEIGCAAEDGGALVTISDRGGGIPPEDGSQIFAKFHRGRNGPVQGRRGTGLGLYIAARLCAAMGASIGHAERPGGGTVFSIRLPS